MMAPSPHRFSCPGRASLLLMTVFGCGFLPGCGKGTPPAETAAKPENAIPPLTAPASPGVAAQADLSTGTVAGRESIVPGPGSPGTYSDSMNPGPVPARGDSRLVMGVADTAPDGRLDPNNSEETGDRLQPRGKKVEILIATREVAAKPATSSRGKGRKTDRLDGDDTEGMADDGDADGAMPSKATMSDDPSPGKDADGEDADDGEGKTASSAGSWLVLIDGEPLRSSFGGLQPTPCMATVKAGRHVITLSRPGCRDLSKSVELVKPQPVIFDLPPQVAAGSSTISGPLFDTVPGDVVPLDAINTAGRESDPWFSADGNTLYFAGKRSEGTGIFVSRRSSTFEQFGPPELITITRSGDLSASPSTVGRETELAYVQPERGRAWLLRRTKDQPEFLDRMPLVSATAVDALWPSSQLSGDGSRFYWVEDVRGKLTTQVAVRNRDGLTFGKPAPVKLPGDHPCLSGDERTQYVFDGQRLQRAKRTTPRDSFGPLELVKQLARPIDRLSHDGRGFAVSADEQWLVVTTAAQQGDLAIVRLFDGSPDGPLVGRDAPLSLMVAYKLVPTETKIASNDQPAMNGDADSEGAAPAKPLSERDKMLAEMAAAAALMNGKPAPAVPAPADDDGEMTPAPKPARKSAFGAEMTDEERKNLEMNGESAIGALSRPKVKPAIEDNRSPYEKHWDIVKTALEQRDYKAAADECAAALDDPQLQKDRVYVAADQTLVRTIAAFHEDFARLAGTLPSGTAVRVGSNKLTLERVENGILYLKSRTKEITKPLWDLSVPELVAIADDVCKDPDQAEACVTWMCFEKIADKTRETWLARMGDRRQGLMDSMARRELYLADKALQRHEIPTAMTYLDAARPWAGEGSLAGQIDERIAGLYDAITWKGAGPRAWVRGPFGEWTATPEMKEDSWLVTSEPYADFTCELEWKVNAPNGQGGVFFQYGGDGNPNEYGYKIQLANDGTQKGMDQYSTGSLFGSDAPVAKANKPAGQWNTMKLQVQGSKVVVWINGTKVLETTIPVSKENPKGYIALDGVPGGISYRKVIIYPTSP